MKRCKNMTCGNDHPIPLIAQPESNVQRIDREVFKDRQAFYLEQIKDPSNHNALAFDLAYSRATKTLSEKESLTAKDAGYFYNLVMHALMDIDAQKGSCEYRLRHICEELADLMNSLV